MKKLLLLLAFGGFAHADTIAIAENRSGGTTILTDVTCKTGSGYYVYSQSPRAPTIFGCWWSDDVMVHITWYDGEFRSYPLTIFTFNERNVDRLRAREKGRTY